MTVRLRPHHLLCVLTYVGKGYSAAFTENYDRIVKRLSDGEDILVVDGADDICAPLLGTAEAHCDWPSVTERDLLAARDVGALLGIDIVAGSRITLDARVLALMREAFASRSIRQLCANCEWTDLCDAIAAENYRGTKLQTTCC